MGSALRPQIQTIRIREARPRHDDFYSLPYGTKAQNLAHERSENIPVPHVDSGLYSGMKQS